MHIIRSQFASKSQPRIQSQVNATLFLVFLFIFIAINLTFTILTVHSIQWPSPFSTVFSLIVIFSVVISAVVVCIVLCCTKLPKIFKLNVESGTYEAAKDFQEYSNNPLCHEEENMQPLYQTIENRAEELYQEPVPLANQLNPGLQTQPVREYYELEQQWTGSNSDSENETDVDVAALQQETREEREMRERRESNRRISAQLEEEERRRRSLGDENMRRSSSITEPQQQETWFNTLDPSSLCAPAPVTYANGTQLHADSPVSSDPHELEVLHNEIDVLYLKKSAVRQLTAPTADSASGDYVDLKDDTQAVDNNWYEDPGSSLSNHRTKDVSQNVYANATDTSPFDDAQYCTVSEARQYTPDVPRRYDLV